MGVLGVAVVVQSGHAGVGLVAGLRADALVALCLARAECRFVLGTKPCIPSLYSELRALMVGRVSLTFSPCAQHCSTVARAGFRRSAAARICPNSSTELPEAARTLLPVGGIRRVAVCLRLISRSG